MREIVYDRLSALNYARKWAFTRNPTYYNFDFLGGDCTNFVSQCIFAGAKTMNYSPVLGWYYNSLNDRTPSWTGVEYFYDFITNNKGVGPFGKETNASQVDIADVVQLARSNLDYYHTLFISKINDTGIFVASHTSDSFDRPLSSYGYTYARFIKILGVRKN